MEWRGKGWMHLFTLTKRNLFSSLFGTWYILLPPKSPCLFDPVNCRFMPGAVARTAETCEYNEIHKQLAKQTRTRIAGMFNPLKHLCENGFLTMASFIAPLTCFKVRFALLHRQYLHCVLAVSFAVHIAHEEPSSTGQPLWDAIK